MRVCVWMKSDYKYVLEILEDSGSKLRIKRFFFAKRRRCFEEEREVSRQVLRNELHKCVDLGIEDSKKLCRFIKKICGALPTPCLDLV